MICSFVLSYDDQSIDIPILIVGRKRLNQSVEIINAFHGCEAVELYNQLTTVKKPEGGSNEYGTILTRLSDGCSK